MKTVSSFPQRAKIRRAGDDLDHDPSVLRLDHMIVSRAAVAQVVAELER
jgi:hypothetical protein